MTAITVTVAKSVWTFHPVKKNQWHVLVNGAHFAHVSTDAALRTINDALRVIEEQHSMTDYHNLLNRAHDALEAKDYDRARSAHRAMDRFLDTEPELSAAQERKLESTMFDLRDHNNF